MASHPYLLKKSGCLLACFTLALFASAAGESSAAAQEARGIAVNRFEPSERGSDWFANESLDLRGDKRFAAGVVADYEYRPLATYDSSGNLRESVVRNMMTLHAGGGITLFDRLRLAVSIPLIVFEDGHADRLPDGTFYQSPTHEQAIGDLRLSADIRILGTYGDPFTLAGGVSVWAPTGSEGTYTSDGDWRFEPRAMVAGDVGIFTYAAKLGIDYRGRAGTFGNGQIGSELAYTAAAGVRVADKKLTMGPELWGTTTFDNAFSKLSTPLEGVIGAHYLAGDSIRIGAGIGTGLTRGYGSPEIRALLGVEYMQAVITDRDGDGILDKDDACPDVKGIRSDDPAKNGCPPPPPPPPSDRDHDGVIDSDDACPDLAGVATSDPKTNGCPPDRDHDGVYDSEDACPDVAGVRTNNPKTNGCPPDSDGDGIIDAEDACPDVPGLKTDDPKTNGCPDPDRDKDGIPNAEDACPDEPGPKDPDPKRNGCPKAFVKDGQIKILDQVKFKTGSAQIVAGKDSEDVLDAVVKVLGAHPEIKKIRVEGHTDNRGSAALNKKLSGDRAASVVKWLTAHGIDKDRLESQGFGADRPIDANDTDAGRLNNRRVEFHIE